MPGDGPRTLSRGIDGYANQGLTCDGRASYAKRHCLEFLAVERWLDPAMCVSQFLYLTVLRDPIRRIESLCRFEDVAPEAAMSWLSTTVLPPYKVSVGTAVVDNFYVRSLGGNEVYHRAAGGITRRDLDRARERLDAFEVVLILEKLDEQAFMLALALGWRLPESSLTRHSFGKGNSDRRFTARQLAELTDGNQLDVELYRYAVRRAEQLAVGWRLRGASLANVQTQRHAPRRAPNCQMTYRKWVQDQDVAKRRDVEEERKHIQQLRGGDWSRGRAGQEGKK
eukprot:CAMPEP_0118994036 /NCGR_PEP_ID=MMETSP1173-20130426/56125_1 /TAXON_ID=1034831 /ORGANISM="Rhizochromulina marina cf, Strain CCMP1243" /LENGTH=281 /DNA_ID=CAMNT_0006945297 /DNA_START=23 /DNA_END=868 /DNA_ORIENTATION=-